MNDNYSAFPTSLIYIIASCGSTESQADENLGMRLAGNQYSNFTALTTASCDKAKLAMHIKLMKLL